MGFTGIIGFMTLGIGEAIGINSWVVFALALLATAVATSFFADLISWALNSIVNLTSLSGKGAILGVVVSIGGQFVVMLILMIQTVAALSTGSGWGMLVVGLFALFLIAVVWWFGFVLIAYAVGLLITTIRRNRKNPLWDNDYDR